MLGPHDKDLLLQQWNAEQCLAETTYPQTKKKYTLRPVIYTQVYKFLILGNILTY